MNSRASLAHVLAISTDPLEAAVNWFTERAPAPFNQGDKLRRLLSEQDSAARLVPELQTSISPAQVASLREVNTVYTNLWCDFGNFFLCARSAYEALWVYEALYEHMLDYQVQSSSRVHKGLPLFRMVDCHQRLNRPVHAKRYLMLTLLEDAISGQGQIALGSTGCYWRLVWSYGLSDGQVKRYAAEAWELFGKHPSEGLYPEWLLQRLGQECYCQWLLSQLGTGAGKPLEELAHYLVGCMPGCRAYHRKYTPSTDYDVVGVFEGPLLDFRSEAGRYFVCECKDKAKEPADFTDVAKFCRVLDSTKARFGIMVSRNGISGEGRRHDADLERLKVYQDRGIVIIMVKLDDLKKIATGENFISMLREKYMAVRLDLNNPARTGID